MKNSFPLLKSIKIIGSERGGSILEMCFIAPIMLMVSGATIDIGRYLRYQQITSTISQELANHVYRKCSDITAFVAPQSGSTYVDTSTTNSRIQQCADSERGEAQLALQNALPGSLVRVSVFRHNIDTIFQNSSECSGTLTEVPSNPSSKEKEDCKNPSLGQVTAPGGDSTASGPSMDQIAASRLSVSGLTIKAGNTVVADQTSICRRNRLVVVEVGYQFKPIVAFLPRILTGFGLDKEGTHRETTVL